MKSTCRQIAAIFAKDVLIELRAKHGLPTMIILALLIAWVFRIAGEAGGAGAVMGVAALWTGLIFAGLSAQERFFLIERQDDCVDGLLLAPIGPATLYAAKVLVSVFMLCILEAILILVVTILFGMRVNDWIFLSLVLLLGNLAISSAGTLFAAAISGGGAASSLLSAAVLALLMPFMIPAVFALLSLTDAIGRRLSGTGALAFVGSFSAALGYLAAFDVLFVIICGVLFGFVLEE